MSRRVELPFVVALAFLSLVCITRSAEIVPRTSSFRPALSDYEIQQHNDRLPESIRSVTGVEFLKGQRHKHSQEPVLLETGVKGMGGCKTCVYVLERIKQGYQYLLPAICVEVFSKETSAAEGKKDFGECHQVLASLSVWGNNVRHWFHYGCYKAESYGAMELIRPCPSHVICSQMADFEKKPFCNKIKPDALMPAS